MHTLTHTHKLTYTQNVNGYHAELTQDVKLTKLRDRVAIFYLPQNLKVKRFEKSVCACVCVVTCVFECVRWVVAPGMDFFRNSTVFKFSSLHDCA